jgi:predicted lactoylglutathione lyase
MTPLCAPMILFVLAVSFPPIIQAQLATNLPLQSIVHKPRPLVENEVREVRSRGLDPKGMTINADLPIVRLLTSEELRNLEEQGIVTSTLTNQSYLIFSKEERTALEKLIAKAQQADATPTPPELRHAFIWMDSFMGETNACIQADVINMKTDALKFQLAFKDYEYSGHYTVVLNKPREHKNPFFGFRSPSTAKLLILENFGGDMMPLTNATIWEKKQEFIDAVSFGKEWIHSGSYSIQN